MHSAGRHTRPPFRVIRSTDRRSPIPCRCNAMAVCRAWQQALSAPGPLWEAAVLIDALEDGDANMYTARNVPEHVHKELLVLRWLRRHGSRLRQLHIRSTVNDDEASGGDPFTGHPPSHCFGGQQLVHTVRHVHLELVVFSTLQVGCSVVNMLAVALPALAMAAPNLQAPCHFQLSLDLICPLSMIDCHWWRNLTPHLGRWSSRFLTCTSSASTGFAPRCRHPKFADRWQCIQHRRLWRQPAAACASWNTRRLSLWHIGHHHQPSASRGAQRTIFQCL